MILISHDRAIIDATCDHLLVLDGAGCGRERFSADTASGRRKQEAEAREQARYEAEEKERKERDERKRRGGRGTQGSGGGRGRVRDQTKQTPSAGVRRGSSGGLSTEDLEATIATLTGRIKAIDEELAFPETWKDHAHAQSL
jgi:ATPase subunit of ABC transporter with duplicated ATPase domains